MKAPFIMTRLCQICLLQGFLLSALYAQPDGTPIPLAPPQATPGAKIAEPPGEPLPADLKQLPKAPLLPDRAAEVLDYWFGVLPSPDYFPEDKMSLWLGGSPEIDRQIADTFSQDVLNARRGDYNSWRSTPRGRLALVILLDQIPRHIYRNTPQAFSSDPMARGLVIEGIQNREDTQLYPVERAFFYLPLEHSEDLAMQNMSVAEYQRLLGEAPFDLKPEMQDFLDYAVAHRQQIARFGRFPARNSILGRKSTPEEMLYLRQAGQMNF